MMSIRLIASLAAIAAASACAPRREPAPAPEPAPTVRQAPPPRPTPPPPPAPGWEDAALTPGGWTLRAQGAEAAFGASGGEALFTVRCDRASRRVTLTRQGSGSGPLVVRTSTTARTLATAAPALSATLAVNDPLLDAMVFSRGRFAVEAAGLPRLVIPAWPEPARVIEECRG